MKRAILLSIVLHSIVTASTTDMKLPVVSAGEIIRLTDFKSDYLTNKTVDIWLPPGYSEDNTYPVIYMHDGRMLFDANITWNGMEWKIDEVAGRLIKENKVAPFIVVGIWNAGLNRHSEYIPQKPFEALPEALKEIEYARLRGNQKLFNTPVYSDDYLKFIVNELKPYINSRFNTDHDQSFLMGSSMGGLISWYGLMEYPDEFSGSASLSTHWPGNFESDNNPIPPYFIDYIRTNINRLNDHRVYFDHGTVGLEAMYPSLQSQVNDLFTNADVSGLNWFSGVFEGTKHSEEDWAERVDIPIIFLLTGNKPR